MPITLVVEPGPTGHRFPYVRFVVENLPASADVVLLTSVGAQDLVEYALSLGDLGITTIERFASANPRPRELAAAVAEICRVHDVSIVLVMDADVPVKRWWWVAAAEFRTLHPRPVVSFLFTRYPMRLSRSPRTWLHRVAKGGLTLLAMLTHTLARAGAIAAHDDMARGLLISRVRDPAYCGAHSRDRRQLRVDYGLDQGRRLVGIFGRITVDKNVPMLLDAVHAAGEDVDLVVAGPVEPDVGRWLAALPSSARSRVVVHDGFLEERVLDGLLAACDVVSIVQSYDRPSAVMGRAFAAGVPVVSAGSKIRSRELHRIGGGIGAELTVVSVTEALHSLLDSTAPAGMNGAVPVPTPLEFTELLLGRSERPAPWLSRLARR